MNLIAKFAPMAVAGACALTLSACETETVALSPPMHTRIIDGVTKLPLDGVRVTLVARDGPESVSAYSDGKGVVHMPPLLGQDNFIVRHMSDTPRLAVHAIFERPGYETYWIDSVNGYGFFKGYDEVRLYRADLYPD